VYIIVLKKFILFLFTQKCKNPFLPPRSVNRFFMWFSFLLQAQLNLSIHSCNYRESFSSALAYGRVASVYPQKTLFPNSAFVYKNVMKPTFKFFRLFLMNVSTPVGGFWSRRTPWRY
jgi:hypothetical protein